MSNSPVIRPEILITNSYLNKVIEFIPDERFLEASLVHPSAAGTELRRDISDYVVVTLDNPDPEIFKVEMTTRTFDRSQLPVIIDTTFSEL
jgi:hypothetical protein